MNELGNVVGVRSLKEKLFLLGRVMLKTMQHRQAAINSRFMLPSSSFETNLLHIDPEKLKHFHQVVEWPSAKGHLVHPCYLHTLAFPLHLKLMLQDDFPFPLLGLVHVHNQIEQFRAINTNEAVVLNCYLSELSRHGNGWIFSIISEAKINDELVWRANSKNLYRLNTGRKSKKPAVQQVLLQEDSKADSWFIQTDVGRCYARVSGDYNPIHLHPWLARLFGFKRHIAHGMWSKAKCLSGLADQLDKAFVVNVDFKKPIFLPAQVTFSQHCAPAVPPNNCRDHIDFQLSSSGNETTHLLGQLQY